MNQVTAIRRMIVAIRDHVTIWRVHSRLHRCSYSTDCPNYNTVHCPLKKKEMTTLGKLRNGRYTPYRV